MRINAKYIRNHFVPFLRFLGSLGQVSSAVYGLGLYTTAFIFLILLISV